jgi:hypothetical protein
MAAVEKLLNELANLLNADGLNYVVSLRLYQLPYAPGARPEQYIAQALGPAVVVGGSSPATGSDILAEVEDALRHAGNHGYGPSPVTLCSVEFNELLRRVLSDIEQTVSAATVTTKISLKEGHPDVPVFWDFGFVLAGPHGAQVIIGSSSD